MEYRSSHVICPASSKASTDRILKSRHACTSQTSGALHPFIAWVAVNKVLAAAATSPSGPPSLASGSFCSLASAVGSAGACDFPEKIGSSLSPSSSLTSVLTAFLALGLRFFEGDSVSASLPSRTLAPRFDFGVLAALVPPLPAALGQLVYGHR